MDVVRKHTARIVELCARWGIRELSVFGSAGRGQLGPGSGIDLLVNSAPDADRDLIDLLHVKDDLEAVFGRRVGLVEREALERGDNWIVRQEILATVEPIYAPAQNHGT